VQEEFRRQGLLELPPSKLLSRGVAYITYLTALLYLTGYMFWLAFLSAFNLEPQALDLPATTIWMGNFEAVATVMKNLWDPQILPDLVPGIAFLAAFGWG
jgi:hypothetical protein